MDIQLVPVNADHIDRYYQMLCSPNYTYFGLKVASKQELRDFLENQKELREKKALFRYIYSVIFEGVVVGSVWVTCSYPRTHIGEITYFIDEEYWGRGIASQAVLELEKIAFQTLGCQKLTIVIKTENIASEKVAIKAGYVKEAVLRGEILSPTGELVDAVLYGKLKSEF